jgi:L-fuculose-phosphate aldolase
MGDIMREAHKRGWITTRDGNISVRRQSKFYITPSGWRKTIIHPEHILKAYVRDDGSLKRRDVIGKPSGELEMHRLLQTVDFAPTSCRSVVHLHPTYTIAAMHRGFNLQELAAEFPEVGRYTRVAPTVRVLPVTSDILARETFAAMTSWEDGDAPMLMFDIVGQAGHGVCAVGKSPWDAFEHIERLEHVCQIVLASGVSPK